MAWYWERIGFMIAMLVIFVVGLWIDSLGVACGAVLGLIIMVCLLIDIEFQRCDHELGSLRFRVRKLEELRVRR